MYQLALHAKVDGCVHVAGCSHEASMAGMLEREGAVGTRVTLRQWKGGGEQDLQEARTSQSAMQGTLSVKRLASMSSVRSQSVAESFGSIW